MSLPHTFHRIIKEWSFAALRPAQGGAPVRAQNRASVRTQSPASVRTQSLASVRTQRPAHIGIQDPDQTEALGRAQAEAPNRTRIPGIPGRRLRLLLLLLPCLLLAACHGSAGQKAFTPPETFDASRQYEIIFWAKNDTNKTQTDIYKQAIADFQKLYPNITVNLRLYTDYGKIYNDVITNIATDTTPNVCITYPDHIATYLTGGTDTVVPLDDLISHPSYGLGGSGLAFDSPGKDEIIGRFLEECTLNGQVYALPYMRSTEACYINKTYVEKLGYTLPDVLTWDFVWEVAEAAAQKGPDGKYLVNGQEVMIPFIYKSTDNMMIQMTRQKGSGYSTEAGEIQLFNDTTAQLLHTVADHVKTGAFSTFKISSYPANFLNAGQCIFAIDSTAGATWMGTHAPLVDISAEALTDFETEVRLIPQFDPANPQMISQGPSVCIFNKEDPQEVAASWLFTQFLLTNEVQIAYAQTEGYVPVTSKAGPSVCIFNKEDPQEVAASWLFTQFLLTNEVQIAYAQTEGYVPVTSKAQNSPAYQDYLSRCGQDNETYYDVKIKASRLLLDHVEDTFVTPVFNGSASLRDAAGQLIDCGQDNETYYDVKIKASRLLLDHVEDTFVTPVFNGSASLRDAAGQLIEEVTKGVRRKKEINDEFIQNLYSDMISLHHLDECGPAAGKAELGPLPPTAVALLSSLGITWGLILVYLAVQGWKGRKGGAEGMSG